MTNKKLFSRRNFVKSGIAATGLSIIGKPSFCATDCSVDTLKTPGPIPLNEIFADYQQVTKKYASGLMKVTICDKESWESKRLTILRRSGMMLGEAPLVSKDAIEPDILAETQRDGYIEMNINELHKI